MNPAVLKENRTHGNPLYPITVYTFSRQAEEPLMDLHWHDELEFLMVTRGSADFRVGVSDYTLRPGEALFINSGELHSGQTSDPNGCSFLAVVFHADSLAGGLDLLRDKYILPLLERKYSVPVHLVREENGQKEILEQLDKLFHIYLEHPPLYEMTTKGYLYLALSRLLLLDEPALSRPKRHADPEWIERLKSVLSYIQENCGETIRLKDLADQAAMSEAHFCRSFKKITTKSPMDYINEVRAQKAAFLLQDTDKKNTEISLDVGFSSLSYYIDVFKRHFGCTPGEYRKRIRRD
ncbi:helix-turn-helix transcriptional regulator [Gorillibacterium massiliense]|uniref:helix-turn-helix transcriptional regulator n=1 Tax=Gorillibacterium massiliense TaxID=1280390 RepID=UPI0004BBE1D7|nr:AraC family transcriptional regulator [Gorillibacterium massiliense]